MHGTIELINPIKIDGKNIKKLKYDTNEITPELFAEAEGKKLKASRVNGNISGAMELDYPLHLYLGLAAIVAVNSDFTFEDVSRIKGRDVVEVMKIGRNFIVKSEESQDDDSDEQSETSPESITPVSQTLNEKG
ncbi:MAG: hypothetical protein HDR21_13855 [Lachnospiraceae bacterium]|nr:hypothetical protein [Lachnospiraceae bacterium]